MPRLYTVVLNFQYPPYEEEHGIEFEVLAVSKKEAAREARTRAIKDGRIPVVGKGRHSFSVKGSIPIPDPE